MSRSLRRSINTVFENSGENALDSSGSTGNLLDRENENPNHRKSMRYFAFHELLQTETNYLDVLNSIINNFKEPLYSSQLIPSREFWKIFGKRRFEDLRVVHEHILSSMLQLDRQWTEKALVGQVWATALDDFRRVYIPYYKQYDEIKVVLNNLVAGDPRIAKLIQDLEAKSRDKKYRLEDLLIRPIQRLTSVKLLLTRLLKATAEKNPDRQWLLQAQIAVDTVLVESNLKREETDSYAHTMALTNQIDHFPPELVNSNCLFMASADFRVLKGAGIFAPVDKKVSITFFLFSQYLTSAKRRIQRSESTGTPNSHRMSTLSLAGFNQSANNTFGGTLQRNPSFMSFMKPKERVRKPFKHLETIRFPDVRELTYLQEGGIFFVRLRDTMSEECTALQIARNTDVKSAVDFFNTLCRIVNTSSTRHLELIEVSDRLKQAELGMIEADDDVELMQWSRKSAQEVENGSIRPTSTLRRTFSNVSLFSRTGGQRSNLNMSRASLISEQ